MIAAWMLYALLVGAVAAVVARSLAGLLELLGRPTRWAWVLGLLGTLALAASAPFRAHDGAGGLAVDASRVSVVTSAAPAAPVSALARWGADALSLVRWAARAPVHGLAPPLARWLGDMGGPLLAAAWALLSLLVLAAFGATALRHRRQRLRAPLARLDGTEVRITERVGPLVAGLSRPEIVVPRWLVTAPREERVLVLAHEEEHRRARDPLLLAGAAAAVVALPWHPAVWWLASRLHLAVETDCDARVVRRGAERHAYGSLLIDVAGRSSGLRLGVPALAGSYSHLERRLNAMTPRTRRPRVLRGGILAAVALLGSVAACESTLPTATDVANMDVTAAEQGAQQLSVLRERDTDVYYFVDGVLTPADQAKALDPKDIEAIRVFKGQMELPDGVERPVDSSLTMGVTKPSSITGDLAHAEIHILTKDAPQAARAAWEESATKEGAVGGVMKRRSPGPEDEAAAARAGAAAEGRERTKVALREVATGSDATAHPLVLIDGVRADESALRSLDPATIASVEVVKGAAAQRLFGEDGANGVIQVHLKKK